MQFISYLVQKFYSMPFQDFTERLSGAVSIFEAISLGDSSKNLKKDYDRLLWIGEFTHEDIKVSFFKLDMCVSKSENFDKGFSKFRFFKADETDESGIDKQITLTEDKIQYFLCKAGIEINQIVSRNIKPYSDEFKLQEFGEEKTEKKGGAFDGI